MQVSPKRNTGLSFGLLTPIRLMVMLRVLVMMAGLAGVLAFIGLNSKHLVDPQPYAIASQSDVAQMSAATVRQNLAQQPLANQIANHRSYQPFWIYVPNTGLNTNRDDLVVIGDNKLRHIELWAFDANGKVVAQSVGDRSSTSHASLKPYDQGFVFNAKQLQVDSLVLKVRAVGSSNFQVGWQSPQQFNDASAARTRLAAGLAASLLALAAFTAVLASFTQNSALAASAVWTVSLLTVTSITLGYDLLWLSYDVSHGIEVRFKQLILAIFMISSVLLHHTLFRREASRLGIRKLSGRVLTTVSIALPVAALIIPVTYFIPAFWAVSIAALVYLGISTVRIAMRFRSPTTSIFGWSWGAISVCIVAEILYKTGLIPRIPGISFETGAIVGSFMAVAAATTSFYYERKRRMQAMSRARQATRQYRETYKQVPSGLLRLDENGQIEHWNPASAQLLGIADPSGISLASIVGTDVARDLVNSATTKSGVELPAQIKLDDKTIRLHGFSTGAGLEVALTDITAIAKLSETLEDLAIHDFLTGTKSAYGISLVMQTAQAELDSGSTWVFYHVSINNFPAIIKLQGRQAADEFLRQISARIIETVGENGNVGRLGNDEFVVACRVDTECDPYLLGTDIVDTITSAPNKYKSIVMRLSCSVGMAFASPTVRAEEALIHAQRACDEGPSNAAGSVSVFDPSGPLNERLHVERYWDDFVQSEAYKGSLELWGQPIVPLLDLNAPSNLEVLLRIRNSHGDIEPPSNFLEAAQRHSLMPDIDRYILEETLKFLSANTEFANRIGYVAVNLSAASINNRAFLGDLTILLSQYPKAAGSLCLEITEQIALIDLDATKAFTDEMHALGVRLALDDFGSGYTSFAYLPKLSANVLKMDGSFILDLDKNKQAQGIVSAIITMAHTLDLKCVAEWVETDETAKLLTQLGCDYAQGYYYNPVRPLQDWLSHEDVGLPEKTSAVVDDA